MGPVPNTEGTLPSFGRTAAISGTDSLIGVQINWSVQD